MKIKIFVTAFVSWFSGPLSSAQVQTKESKKGGDNNDRSSFGPRRVLRYLVCVGISWLALVPSPIVQTSVSSHCADCTGDRPKLCQTPVIGNDGQTRYRKICCQEEDECGERQYPNDRWLAPYCKIFSKCRYFGSLGREYLDKYDPQEQCCTEYGLEPKSPIRYFERCRKTRVVNPSYVSQPNGCGDKDHPLDPTDSEEIKGRTIGGKADFTEPCNAHDTCYDTCNRDKDQCDEKFLTDMYAVCTSKYSKSSAPLAHCKKMAKNWFYQGVQSFVGRGAYEDAQSQACKCCE
jgi:hypothetical protein